jgi:Domain of unknown function (DUF4259)
MGSWGYGPFDDDNALEWVLELEQAKDWGVVESALTAAAATPLDTYLLPPDANIAWAAAAVVAAAESPDVALPDRVAAWLRDHRATCPAKLRPLAADALRRVLAGKPELPELRNARELAELLEA